jgi:hypothetical protein
MRLNNVSGRSGFRFENTTKAIIHHLPTSLTIDYLVSGALNNAQNKQRGRTHVNKSDPEGGKKNIPRTGCIH